MLQDVKALVHGKGSMKVEFSCVSSFNYLDEFAFESNLSDYIVNLKKILHQELAYTKLSIRPFFTPFLVPVFRNDRHLAFACMLEVFSRNLKAANKMIQFWWRVFNYL